MYSNLTAHDDSLDIQRDTARDDAMLDEIHASTPLQAIRTFCIGCSGFSQWEADRCKLHLCPLHPHRHGEER